MATSTFQRLNEQGTVFADRAKGVADAAASVYIAHITILEVIGLLVTLAFIAGTASIIIKTKWIEGHVTRFKKMLATPESSRKQSARSWSSIQRHFFAGNDNDLKIAIIDADKLLDESLRNAGVFGATLGDRLKKVKPSQLANLDEVWQAHKLRNQIAHEGDFTVKRDIAERALTIYKEALESLGAIPKQPVTPPSTPKLPEPPQENSHLADGPLPPEMP